MTSLRGSLPRGLRSDVDSDPAGRAQGPVAFGRAPVFVAALDRGPARPLTPLASAAIEDHPHAIVAVERVGQRLVALRQVPRYDEQDATAGWDGRRALRGMRSCSDPHRPPA